MLRATKKINILTLVLSEKKILNETKTINPPPPPPPPPPFKLNGRSLNDAKEVSENFNSFFSTVADKIGQHVVYDPSTNPSIVEIKNHVDIDNNFDFQNITAERVEKIINTINIKKATGADNIPTKVVRQCKVTVAQQLSSLINLSINTGVFPNSLKVAQVTPIHKKNDPLNKSNYRPVSVLPIFQKYIKVIEIQLADYFDKIFNPFLCAFRRSHTAQTSGRLA